MKRLFLTGLVREGTRGENDTALYVGDDLLAEEMQEFAGLNVYSVFAFSPDPIDATRLHGMAVDAAIGILDAEYGDHYSEITGYLWTDENGKIGGHDMVEIFRSHTGEYGCLVVQTEPIDVGEIAGEALPTPRT